MATRVAARRRPVSKPAQEVPTNVVESKAFVRVSTPSAPGLPPNEEHREEILEVHKFITTPAEVNVVFGVTKSLGEGTYEFLRIDVGVKMPCYVEQVPETQDRVADMVNAKLEDELSKFLG